MVNQKLTGQPWVKPGNDKGIQRMRRAGIVVMGLELP
jgi:hypothetical protein